MSIFHLPDLGEGLPDAEIHQWYVQVGDHVKQDDPLVSMETAKAVVDVPAPQTGVILELLGHPGDIIKTGAPLVLIKVLWSENWKRISTPQKIILLWGRNKSRKEFDSR
jgi:2-oxoisovalerate dehydrogenase E2 component (dihydrolipoyl transacylase)